MRYKDWKTQKEWDDVVPESHLSGELLKQAEESCRVHRDRLNLALKEILTAQHLIVLCGSGTSLDLNVVEGRKADPAIAPSMADLWKAIRRRIESRELGLFQKILNYVNYTPEKGSESVQSLLSACLVSERFKSTPLVKAFIEEAEREIALQCNFLKGREDLTFHETFLRRVACRPTRLPRARLFTTNYDLCFERAAAQARFLTLDGFSHSVPQEFDISHYDYDWVRREDPAESSAFVPNLFHLYKLHGGIDWERTDAGVIKNPRVERPLLFYPNRDRIEFSIEPPFLEIMARFQVSLRQPNTGLLIIGYGFNDLHLSPLILQAIRFNFRLRVLIVAPTFDLEHNPHQKALGHYLKAGDPRLGLLCAGFADLVRLMPNLAEPGAEAVPQDRSQQAWPRAA